MVQPDQIVAASGQFVGDFIQSGIILQKETAEVDSVKPYRFPRLFFKFKVISDCFQKPYFPAGAFSRKEKSRALPAGISCCSGTGSHSLPARNSGKRIEEKNFRVCFMKRFSCIVIYDCKGAANCGTSPFQTISRRERYQVFPPSGLP